MTNEKICKNCKKGIVPHEEEWIYDDDGQFFCSTTCQMNGYLYDFKISLGMIAEQLERIVEDTR